MKTSQEIRKGLSLAGPGVSLVVDHERMPVPPPETVKKPSPEKPRQQAEVQGDQNLAWPKVDDKDEQNVGCWLVVDGRAVQLFRFNKENLDYYADVLNRYKANLDKDIRIYSMIAPSNTEFVQLKRYKGITDSQNEALNFLKSRLDPGILSINTYDALNSHTEEYIYFRTDHHWTALGAYYSYCALAEAVGEKPVPLERYQRQNIIQFVEDNGINEVLFVNYMENVNWHKFMEGALALARPDC